LAIRPGGPQRGSTNVGKNNPQINNRGEIEKKIPGWPAHWEPPIRTPKPRREIKGKQPLREGTPKIGQFARPNKPNPRNSIW